MSTPLLPLLRAYAAERRRTLTEHPTPDELLDYYLEDGTPEQRELLQDHLALCPDCARAVLDLAAFPDVAPAAGGEGPPDKAAAWNRLRDRAFAVAPVIRHPSAFPRRAWSVSLIAASLLVASLGVGYYLGGLGTRTSEVFVALVQGNTERSVGLGDVEEIQVPASAGQVMLLLVPEESHDFSSYDAELTHLGKSFLSPTGLHGDSAGRVSVEVPRDLPSGVYTVYLYGVEKGNRTLVLQETVDIEWEDRQN